MKNHVASATALFLLVSCSAEHEDKPFDPASLVSTLTPQCESDFSAFIQRVQAAKACSTVADCSFVKGATPIFEHCGTGYYVNASDPFFDESSGSSQAAQSEATLQQCFDPLSLAGCLGLPREPICWQGKCYVRPVGASPDPCLSSTNTSDCSKCLCGACTGHMSKCLADPGCAELLVCVKKSGAFGRYVAPLPLGATGPCVELIDKWGGPAAASAQSLQAVVTCNHDKGCFALCGQG